MNPFITTSLGLSVPLLNPQSHDIQLRDIAHHLATINRFCGAASIPISVAQHSIIVAQLLERISARLGLLGLLHDAHEAYLQDLPTPVKQAMSHALLAGMASQREILEAGFDAAIYQHFRLAPPDAKESDLIGKFDHVAFVTEWRDLMPDGVPCPISAPPANFRIVPLRWDKAEEKFLKVFDKLSSAVGATP